ncbi:MAG TPA: hypothetical protein HA263_00785 [Methanoregulaceae archaeon]|nr:hypothetical protein [Methanoregulaceae archaeon]
MAGAGFGHGRPRPVRFTLQYTTVFRPTRGRIGMVAGKGAGLERDGGNAAREPAMRDSLT